MEQILPQFSPPSPSSSPVWQKLPARGQANSKSNSLMNSMFFIKMARKVINESFKNGQVPPGSPRFSQVLARPVSHFVNSRNDKN